MNRYKSSAQLKDLAKEKLAGHYGITMSAFILVGLITYFVTLLLTGSMPTQTTIQYMIHSLVTGIISVFLGVFQTGTALLYLNIACGQPCRLEDIFTEFPTSHPIP